MPGGTDGPAALEGGRRLPGLPGAQPCARPPADTGSDVLRVTVVGPDPAQRSRLLQLLAGVPEIEVVGWAESAQTLAVLTSLSGDAVEASPALGNRPQLSPRQRAVLVAYASGNDLLPVVARQLGMKPETVKTHLRRIRAKYRAAGRPAPTRRDLYVRALQDGLLTPPE